MTKSMTKRMTNTAQSAVQVWAPAIELSPYDDTSSRDLHRAREAWGGEDRLWLLPGLPRSVRWKSGAAFWERAVPAEQFNVINIHHVDEGGRMYPQLEKPARWQRGLPKHLYRLWIQSRPRLSRAVTKYRIQAPKFEGESVSYVYREFNVGSGLPIPGAVDVERGEVRLGWPHHLAPISPETESERLYGTPRSQEDLKEENVLHATALPNDSRITGLHFSLEWPAPFNELFFTGGGADRLWHQAQMARLVRLAEEGQRKRALRDTRVWLSRFSEVAEAPLDKAWFLPKALADTELALYEVFANYEIRASDLNELASFDKFRDLMSKNVPVTRVFGWVGYFWWELSRDLQAGLSIRRCQHCGNAIVGGRRHRRYCNRQENPTCYRDRNKLAQQESRSRRDRERE